MVTANTAPGTPSRTSSASATPEAVVAPAPAAAGSRLVALDWLRGLVMVLMTIDHASDAFNAGRLFGDSAEAPVTPLDPSQFFTRWISHICAPTFVLLAGAALALSIEKRQKRESPRAIDRYIVTRGLIIAVLDPTWMTIVFGGGRFIVFQVLYAIGMSLVCMALLRRLPTRWLLGLGLALQVGGELIARIPVPPSLGLVRALLVSGNVFAQPRVLIIAYPLLPWLSIMMLGWVLGRWLATKPARPERPIAALSVGALVVYAVLRTLNGFGNWNLLREGSNWVAWLHVSKYPPSVTYTGLELGLALLILAGFIVIARRVASPPPFKPLVVFGQTAFFFYLLHVHLLELASHLLHMKSREGLGATYLAAALTLVVLYPLCVRYGRYKSTHPDGWTRYL